MKPYFFPAKKLPRGFKYPKSLLDLAESGEIPPIYPWWFLETEEVSTGMMQVINRLHPFRRLVPFAKSDAEENTIACFDGRDTSGDPPVFYIEWTKVLPFAGKDTASNFDQWLEYAIQEAKLYEA